MVNTNKYFMSSIFENTGSFQLDEALNSEKDPRVDGENIIGSVEGVFFVPDGFSRNNRFYPCELWNKQLSDSEINRRLDNSIMFGCIGHSQGPVTEQDLADGKVSHIMNKLWIDESTGMGMGKAYILNTPAGRNLKTYLKAGSNLKVSSRGEGSFAEGVEKDGHPVVESASYNLITFDFVIEPGFIETNPQLMESYIEEVLIPQEEIKKEDIKEVRKEDSMDEKMLEDLKAEKEQAEKSLQESQAKFSETEKSLNEAIESLKEAAKKKELVVRLRENNSKKKIAHLKAVVEELQAKMESYQELGTSESIKKTNAIMKSVIHELKTYKALGTLQDLKECVANQVKLAKELREYRELGSVSELGKLIELSERFVVAKKRNNILESAKAISKETETPIEEVVKLVKQEGVTVAREKLSEKQVKEPTKLDTVIEVKKEEKKSNSMLDEIFATANSKLFISEDEEDDEEEKIEDEEVELEDDEETVEDEESTEEESDDEEETAEDAEENEPSEEERLDTVENDLESIQAQVDALEASFERIASEVIDEEPSEEDETEELDYDIEIE